LAAAIISFGGQAIWSMTELLIRFGLARFFLSSALPRDGHLDAFYVENWARFSFPTSCGPAVQAPLLL